jgi:3-isopropylmalate dehydrogenase
MSLKIAILPGDDIGLEVVPECIKVMKAAAAREQLDIDWRPLPIGKKGHEEHGHTLPVLTEQALRELDGWIMGPIGHAAYPRGDPTWVMPPVRKKFDLFAAVRPALSHAAIPSIHKDVDIVFLRELTEGLLYSETVVAGLPEFRPNDDITVAMRVITRRGSNRVAREAFEIARTRARKKVTAAHKEPVYRLACGMFAEECRKVARDYPDVTFEEMMIDSISMKLVTVPQQFDVVVTTNQFGDILTDIGAGLVGGLGLAPGPVRRRAAGDGAGDPRLGARHRRTQHRQPLRHDHAGADAARLARPQTQRARSNRRRRTHPGGGQGGDRRAQAPDPRSRGRRQHHGNGRRHRRRCARIRRAGPRIQILICCVELHVPPSS